MGKLKKRKDGRYMKWVTLQGGTRKPVYARSEPELNRKVKEITKQDEQGVVLDDKTTIGNGVCAGLMPTSQACAETRSPGTATRSTITLSR